MNGTTLPFDDSLDLAIDALQRGRPLDAIVSDHANAMLAPLIETAADARLSFVRPPLSRTLEHNYAIVRAAVERAQMAAAAQPHETARPAPTSWWRRRMTSASLSLPVAVALALGLGAAGAAASLVATDQTGVLGDFIAPSQPDASAPDEQQQGDRGSEPAVDDDGGSGHAPGLAGAATDNANRPYEVAVGGTVSDVNGNTFTLTVGASEYNVEIDNNTAVDGVLLEGSTAEVTGDLTAEKNLHAKDVSAQGGTPTAEHGKPEDAGKPDDAGGPDDTGKPEDTPGQDGGPAGNGNESNNGEGGQPKKP